MLGFAWACAPDSTGPGIPDSLSLSPTEDTILVGETVQLTPSLLDSRGSPLPTSGVSWISSNANVAAVSSSGLVSALAVGGPVDITASSGTLTAHAQIIVEGGPAAQLSVATQPSPNGVNGEALSRQPTVQLRDADGNEAREAGVLVTAVFAEGQGTLANASATTDTFGRATFSGLTISGAAGVYRLRFQSTGLSAATSNSIALSAGSVATLEVVVQPSTSAQSGVALATQPQISVLDDQDNPISGEPVTVSIGSGGGTLAGTMTAIADASGVATFTDLAITGTVGDRTLAFAAGTASVESGTIALAAGAPASVVMVTQPSATAQSGVPFGQQPTVEVRDSEQNLVEGFDVGASIASGGGTLGGATTVATDATGRARFTDLAITGDPGARTLRFQAGSASATSGSVDVTVGAPATVTILTQPSSTAQNGVELAQQPVVEVEDASGTATAGAVVTVSIATGGGTLGGTASATVADDGTATFTDLSITGSVGDRTLRFTAGTASATSGTISLEAGALAELVITLQPSSSASNAEPFAQQPRVRAEDASDNPISGVSVTAAIQSGDGSLGGTKVLSTDGTGVAAFTNLAITGTVGTRTLQFSSATFNVVSTSIDVGPGAPASVSIVTQPPDNAPSGTTFMQSPAVSVEDVSGNAVPGQDVVASIASGGGSIGGTTTVATDGSGSATFGNLSITASTPGARTLLFTAGSAQQTSDIVHVSYSVGLHTDLQYCGSSASQRLDVSIPSGALPRPLPLAAFIHGGGWVYGDKADGTLLDEVRDLLLADGYVVVSLNYRLATSSTNKWPTQINDVKCAIRHLRAEAADYGFDGARIGVWGPSAGGHLASMLGVTDADSGFEGSGGYGGQSSRVSAAVAIGGISDLTAGFPNAELDFFGPELTFTSYPGPSAELDEASPIWWETPDDPPFLLVHGDQDTTVAPAQATRLDGQLDAVGVSSTLQIVTNAGHNLEDVGGTASPSLAQVAQQIADFFEAHVLPGT